MYSNGGGKIQLHVHFNLCLTFTEHALWPHSLFLSRSLCLCQIGSLLSTHLPQTETASPRGKMTSPGARPPGAEPRLYPVCLWVTSLPVPQVLLCGMEVIIKPRKAVLRSRCAHMWMAFRRQSMMHSKGSHSILSTNPNPNQPTRATSSVKHS